MCARSKAISLKCLNCTNFSSHNNDNIACSGAQRQSDDGTWIEFRSWGFPLLAHWDVYFCEIPLSTWDFHLGPRPRAGPPFTHPRDQPLEFQGSAALFVAPLILISSFIRECGVRIVPSRGFNWRFYFPVPLHTSHRIMLNNRHFQKRGPIIKLYVLLWVFTWKPTQWLPACEL